jgi:hypothetical protein
MMNKTRQRSSSYFKCSIIVKSFIDTEHPSMPSFLEDLKYPGIGLDKGSLKESMLRGWAQYSNICAYLQYFPQLNAARSVACNIKRARDKFHHFETQFVKELKLEKYYPEGYSIRQVREKGESAASGI